MLIASKCHIEHYMMLPPRPSRVPRPTDARFAQDDAPENCSPSAPASSSQTRPQHHRRHHATTNPASTSASHYADARPAKKRKLSLRHRQTTLDGFTITTTSAQSDDAPKPPTRVTATDPYGPLVETLNGVRAKLDTDLDHVSSTSRSHPPERLVPSAGGSGEKKKQDKKKEERRSLRSQDEGPRLKSELAVYFPNYEEIVFDLHKEEEFITTETVLYVVDDLPRGKEQPSPAKARRASTTTSAAPATNGASPSTPHQPRSNSSSNGFNGCSPINLDVVSRNLPSDATDPLPDSLYLPSHRRAERREKQLRNIEKERAMHEKVQLERLLDGLLGHDWLKVLGITGITDGEARKYESKRQYFIAEVRALVDKFRQWKEQEKRVRAEKEAAAARDAAESEGNSEAESSEEEPPSSDLNASAARQLQQETANAVRSGFKIRLSNKRKDGSSAPATPTPASASHVPVSFVPPEPIASFYSKRHLRDAALGKSRHGRNVTAFGHPVPEMEGREFELPQEYVTEDALRANARERRRRKRASVADAPGG